ncbi:Uncharacterized protein HZ326_22682 [Fusarium oxysporum f. sp. albedinis]|nr:Uncharacterized protein HZ326_22682 [Fusarium oxysporum f. sp. albedinis]
MVTLCDTLNGGTLKRDVLSLVHTCILFSRMCGAGHAPSVVDRDRKYDSHHFKKKLSDQLNHTQWLFASPAGFIDRGCCRPRGRAVLLACIFAT